jgi:hypothetical protein
LCCHSSSLCWGTYNPSHHCWAACRHVGQVGTDHHQVDLQVKSVLDAMDMVPDLQNQEPEADCLSNSHQQVSTSELSDTAADQVCGCVVETRACVCSWPSVSQQLNPGGVSNALGQLHQGPVQLGLPHNTLIPVMQDEGEESMGGFSPAGAAANKQPGRGGCCRNA